MINRILTTIVNAVIILLLVNSSCSPRVHQSLFWQPAPPSFDAPESWGRITGHDERSGIRYALSNDRDNLYVVLSTDDEATRIKMLRGGMQLLIDTLGRQEGHCSIMYPLRHETGFAAGMRGTSPGGMPGLPTQRVTGERPQGSGSRPAPREDAPGRTEMIRHLVGLQTHVVIHGFKEQHTGRVRAMREEGIRVSLDLDSAGTLYYRAIIPLYTFYRELVQPADTARVFGMEIKINGLEMATRVPGGMAPGSREMPPGGGRQGTPTGRGGMAQPGQPGRREAYGGSPDHRDTRELSRTVTFKSTFNLSWQ